MKKTYKAIVNWKVMTLMVILSVVLFVIAFDHIGKYFDRGDLESELTLAILDEGENPSIPSKEEVVDKGKLGFEVVTAKITSYCLKGTMANGEEVYEGSVACPMEFKLDTTKLKIGDVKGYTCTDRMARKYRDPTYKYFIEERWDLWFEDCDDAWEWGIKIIDIKIYN